MLMRNFWRQFCYAPDAEGGIAVADAPEPEVGDVPEPEPEVVAPEPEPEPAVDPNAELYDTLAAFNLNRDPQALAAQLRQNQATHAELQQLRALVWQMQQQQQRPQEPPRPSDKPKLPWTIPEFDRRWLKLLQRDDSGNIVPVAGADPTLGQKYQTWQDAREAALDQLLSDPHGALQSGFAPLIQQAVQQHVQQILGQHSQFVQNQQVEQRLRQFESQNKSWLYDKVTHALTPAGEIWNNAFKAAVQRGIPDPIDFAERHLDSELFRMEQQNPQPAAPAAPRDERMEFLKSRQQANRGGSFNRPNGKKSPAQDADPFARMLKDAEKLFAENPNAFRED